MSNNKQILKSRIRSLCQQFETLEEYHRLLSQGDVKTPQTVVEKSLQDAYLKRFASVQDYLGAKIFPLLAEVGGLVALRMTDILDQLEKEGVIDDLEAWAELRALRNSLEHEYPENPEIGLETLKNCLANFDRLKNYCENTRNFALRFL